MKSKWIRTWLFPILLAIVVAFAALVLRASGSYMIVFLGTGLIYFIFGLLADLISPKPNLLTIILLHAPTLCHHALALMNVQDLYPYYIPVITVVGFANLSLGVAIKANLRHITPLSLVVTLWVIAFSFFAYSQAGRIYMWNTLRYDLPQVSEFELLRPDGTKLTSDSLKGKVVLLDYWSFYCGQCFKKFPELEKLYQQYQDVDDVEIYAVHFGYESLEELAKNRHTKPYSFPILHDPDAKLFLELGLWGVPQMVLFSPDGRAVLNHQGYSPLDEKPFLMDLFISEIEKLRKTIQAKNTIEPELTRGA